MTETLSLHSLTPLREGLLQRDPPRLLGSRCDACGTRLFPARTFCPACDSEAVPAGVVLAPEGCVFSFTTVRQAPGNRPVPYTLAYVDLEDGVRVLAQIDPTPAGMGDAVHIGQRVRLLLRNVVPSPGEPRLGYAFAAVSQEAA